MHFSKRVIVKRRLRAGSSQFAKHRGKEASCRIAASGASAHDHSW